MRVGFLNNQIDGRGTGNAVFNYAHYNEAILGNESKIFTFPQGEHDKEAINLYLKRFGNVHYLQHNSYRDIDVLYHIKSGEDDGFRTPAGVPYLVHSVFHSEPHADRYAGISEWMGLRDGVPFVPHIIDLPYVKSDLRPYLRIPDDATVFGRIGGYDSFDIPWAWRAIEDALKAKTDLYFIFVNTPRELVHPRISYFPPTLDAHAKRAFINSCDAMIHARARGETFGISVGEFSSLGKAIVTYRSSLEKAHIYELRGTALTYDTKEELENILITFNRNDPVHSFYTHFTPKEVMGKFQQVFLSDRSSGAWYTDIPTRERGFVKRHP